MTHPESRDGSSASAGDPHVPSQLQLERVAYRRRQTVRSVLIAAGSTLVVGIVLAVAVTGSPGWPRVQDSFFNPRVAADSLVPILRGLWLNIRLLFFCAIGALVLGMVV